VNIQSVINTKLSAYTILVLQTIYSSWNWFFLLFATISLSGMINGGLITGILFLSNSAVRMLGAHCFATLSEKYTETERLYFSLVTRLAFIVLLSGLILIVKNPFYLILWTILTNILLVIDGYMIFHLKYYFSDAAHISLMRYNTLGNLGSRGVIAIASIMAIWLGMNNWHGLTVTCFVLAIFGVIASCFSIFYARQHKNVATNKPNSTHQTVIDENTQNTATIGAFYLFLMNLCFGAGTLLFTRALLKYDLIIYDNLNIVTFFYIGFITVNIIVTVFDKIFNVFVTWKHILISYFLSAVIAGLFFIFRDNPSLCFTLAIIWGIVYGWSLIAFFPLITELIRGNNQNKLYAKIDSASRFGFILSQLITGFFLDAAMDPLQLLQLYSLFAIACLIFSFIFYKKRILDVVYD